MELKEQLPVPRGVLALETRRADTGELVQRVECHNVLTNAGRQLLEAFLGVQNSFTGIQFVGIGTGTTAAQTNTQLGTEVGRRTLVLYTAPTSGTSNVATYQSFFEAAYPTGVNVIGECGLFGSGTTQNALNASGGGTATATFNTGWLIADIAVSPTVSKDNTLTLTVTYTATW